MKNDRNVPTLIQLSYRLKIAKRDLYSCFIGFINIFVFFFKGFFVKAWQVLVDRLFWVNLDIFH